MNYYRFIAVEKAQHSVVLLCRVLGVAKSAFYAWQHQQLSAHAQADERLTDQIRTIHDESRCTYGAPRVHAELRKHGTRVARKRVARLMRAAKLVGCCPRRFRKTTIPDPTAQIPDLVERQFRPAVPDALWVADITTSEPGRLALSGGHPRCVQSARSRLGTGRSSADRVGERGVVWRLASPTAARVDPSLRQRFPIHQRRVR